MNVQINDNVSPGYNYNIPILAGAVGVTSIVLGALAYLRIIFKETGAMGSSAGAFLMGAGAMILFMGSFYFCSMFKRVDERQQLLPSDP